MATAIRIISLLCIALFTKTDAVSAAGYIRVDSFCRLEDAIRSANSDRAYGGCNAGSGADTIELSRDIALARSLPQIRSDITIRGNWQSIDGNKRFQIFYVAAGASLAIENLTLTRGLGQDDGSLHEGSYKLGGAIFNLGSLSVHGSIFSHNSADDAGGAILNNGSARVTGSAFHDNDARIAGAIDNWSDEAILHISDSEFSNNHAAQFGGAIDNGGSLTIEGSAFYDNSADAGGAINNFTALGLSDSIFSGNQARSGGAIRSSRDQATMDIRGSQFSDNSARFGGAVNINQGYANISATEFQGNFTDTASGGSGDQTGGALSIRSEAHISNSIFRDNYSGNLGGAIHIRGQASISHSLFSGNSAYDAGGAIHSQGEATLSSSDIRQSYAPRGGGIHIADGYFRLRHNILSDNASDDCRVELGRDSLRESRDNHISDGSCGARWRGPIHDGYCPPGQYRGGSCQVGYSAANQGARAAAVEPRTPAQPSYSGIVVDSRCSLADAIHAANEDRARGGCRPGDGADTITLTMDLRLGQDSPAITSEIDLQGNGYTISGDGRYRIFTVDTYGALELNDVTLTEGWAADDGALNLIGDGAAILNLGTVRINRSSLRDNRSGEDGGAIRNAGDLLISGSSFLYNIADRQAGVIYSADATGNPRSATLTISDSEFSYNHSARHGGAIFAEGSLTISNSSFHGNQAAVSGGAVYSLGQASVSRSVFSDNGARKNGGAIFNDYQAHIRISDSELRNNVATEAGGGLMTYGRASATISDSVIHENSARLGGGLVAKGIARNSQVFYGELYLRYNYFSGNRGGDCHLAEYGAMRESRGNRSDGTC